MVKITFGQSGGTMVPDAATIAPGGAVTFSNPSVTAAKLTKAQDERLSSLVRNGIGKLKSEQCPGTFPDESSLFITALGRTVTVRGTCEPGFTKLWSALSNALDPGVTGP